MFAPSAPQQTLEVVVMCPVSHMVLAVGVEDALYAVEQLHIFDERRMPAGVLDALMFHEAEVVPITQQLAQSLGRDALTASRHP
nr:hypothetical protein [Streptomyces capoamus]